MPKCHNCKKDQLGILVQRSSCAVPRCLNELRIVEGSTDNFYCPFHQQEFPTKIKKLENKIAELERSSHGRGSISTPTQEIQALRTENQALTTSLALRDREKADLQAQIRGLETQLSERENNQSNQPQIRKLENNLALVKKKLEEWSKLLTK